MVILIDGVRYCLETPENEAVLERRIEDNYRSIFGEHSFYFPKKKIRSKAGIGTIPDAYLIIPERKLRWCILEVELASHSVYNHVFPQLTKFRRAIEDGVSRKKIRDFFYDTITADKVLEAQFRKQIGTGEIHKTLSDMMDEKPLIVVAIDQRTEELKEALLDFGGEVKVIEFRTYRREGVSDEINAYCFEPIVKKVKKTISKTNVLLSSEVSSNGPKKQQGIGVAIYALFDENGVDNVSYEECEAVAKSVKPETAFNKGHFSWYKNKYNKKDEGSSDEPGYVKSYRNQLKNPDSLISKILKYITQRGSVSKDEMKRVCVENFGCKSDTSGSIGASFAVLERDGYIKTEGRAETSRLLAL